MYGVLAIEKSMISFDFVYNKHSLTKVGMCVSNDFQFSSCCTFPANIQVPRRDCPPTPTLMGFQSTYMILFSFTNIIMCSTF